MCKQFNPVGFGIAIMDARPHRVFMKQPGATEVNELSAHGGMRNPHETMRILFVHAGGRASSNQWHEAIASTAPEHLQVHCFPLEIRGFKKRIHWDTLDIAWKCRHPELLKTYARLHEAAQDADVLLLYGGYNLHPEFLKYLPTFNVYCFYDDPESSDKSSRHVASKFDAVFYCNVASKFQYQDWGCRHMAHLPIFTAPTDIPNREEQERLLTSHRDNDIILCCGWKGGEWRRRRLQKLASAFPQARCFGNGWPEGYIDHEALRDLYCRSRIGWNIHNSTGPINVRLFSLAAWNILQICDNKTGLAEIFELGEEVIGFDTIDEAIDLTRYYLTHEEERRTIAARAHQRYWQEYRPTALWQRIADQIRLWRTPSHRPSKDIAVACPSPSRLSRGLYHSRKLPHSFRQALARWRRSASKRRIPDIWPIDERFYLSKSVPYAPDRPFRPPPRDSARRPAGQNANLECQSLAWAATAFMGAARSLAVLGEETAEHFVALAKRDGRRSIQDLPFNDPDIWVVFNEHAQKWIADTESHQGVRHCLLGFSPRQVHDLGGCDTIYQCLTRSFATVTLYWLPNPVVPWIEPLPGALAHVSILAEGRAHA